MAKSDDGGPAFPVPAIPPREVKTSAGPRFYKAKPAAPGMSLRDWFAGQALTGLIAASAQWSDMGLTFSDSDLVGQAGNLADRMIKERKERGIA